MLNMLIMGPAGSGKGSMSELIVQKYALTHISTGDMFRAEIGNQTELGVLAKSYIDAGKLVPDDVTIAMVSKRLAQKDCQEGYLLDGFPRSLPQAQAYDEVMKKSNREANIVINLTVDFEALASRIENRRTCKKCGAIYNLKTLPPKVDGICDNCGEHLFQRNDDNRDALKVRLENYDKETAPVIEYYRAKGIVYDIDASQSMSEVFEKIDSIIERHINQEA